MKAKKLFGILLAGAMALSAVAGLAACGGDDEPPATDNGLKYYVVGGNASNSTASYLYTVSNWKTEHIPELEMVKEEGTQKYSIELDLIAGDEFKIVNDAPGTGFWDNEMGFGKLATGKNDKDEDVFKETGQYGGNIGLQQGFDGRYKFTLENNSITWQLLQKFEMVTVTYKDGDTVLGTQDVKKGETLAEADLLAAPEKLFMTFEGWMNGTTAYTGGTVNEAFTLTAKYTEEANESYTADETEYYLVGTGEGTLKESGWNVGDGETPVPEALFLTKDTAYTQHNVFTIEATLYAGDQFKIAHDNSWDGAFNYTNLLEADGVPSPFEGSDNLVVKTGHDGVYRITLVTDEGEEGIYYELLEEKESLIVDYYLAGTYATAEGAEVQFRAEPGDWTIHLTEGENDEWTCEVTITENDYIPSGWDDNKDGSVHAAALKVKINGSYYGVDNTAENPSGTTGDGNMLLAAGTYKITFNAETKVISCTLVTAEPAE